jgi:transglutaminase-like putative cysteine protease
MAVRDSRNRLDYLGSHGVRQVLWGTTMLVVVAFLGTSASAYVPFVQEESRTTLRETSEPPFDPRDFGSPLNGFQKYLVGTLREEVLFEIDGLPSPAAGDEYTYVRLAVMDDYDGVVWRVSPRSGTQGGRFVRVGSEAPSGSVGEQRQMTVRVAGLRGVWMPTLGEVSGVDWAGPESRSESLGTAFRLSTVTSTGLVPVGWETGDKYLIRTVSPPVLNRRDVVDIGIDTQVVVGLGYPPPEEILSVANVRTKGKASPLEQLEALEQYFKNGYYASGDVEENEPNAPGHSYARLIEFIRDDRPIGNAEQYASTFAIMARGLGIPARVVMGFRLGDGVTEVTGADVHAWVEVGFANGWMRFDPTSERRERPKNQSKKPKPVFESQDVPPPPVIPPEPEVNTRQGQTTKKITPPTDPEPTEESDGRSPIVVLVGVAAGLPVAGLAVFAAAVLMMKAVRRRRRRRVPIPANRVAGAWAEYVDRARDAGVVVPAAVTRQEAAAMIGTPDGSSLARRADAVVFGGGSPSEDDIRNYWEQVDEARRRLLGDLALTSRIRAIVSTTSLRHP